MGVIGSTTFAAFHCWAGMPRVAVCSVIFVATHHLATVLGVAAVIITPPWMELVIAFPGVVINLSLLPESLDLSWSSSIDRGGGYGKIVGVLLGVEGIGGKSEGLDGEIVVFSGGFL